MFWIIFFIIVLFIWPVWLFIKLARYGQGILRPNFERMQRKIEEWTHFSNNGFFAYNRTGGKIFYYLLLFYLIGSVLGIIIYSLVR